MTANKQAEELGVSLIGGTQEVSSVAGVST